MNLNHPLFLLPFGVQLIDLQTSLYICLGGMMASRLVSSCTSSDVGPGWGHCAVFLDKTIYSLSASPLKGINVLQNAGELES